MNTCVPILRNNKVYTSRSSLGWKMLTNSQVRNKKITTKTTCGVLQIDSGIESHEVDTRESALCTLVHNLDQITGSADSSSLVYCWLDTSCLFDHWHGWVGPKLGGAPASRLLSCQEACFLFPESTSLSRGPGTSRTLSCSEGALSCCNWWAVENGEQFSLWWSCLL